MKPGRGLIVFALTAILAASCGAAGPSEVAINFTNAMADAMQSKDLQQAKQYTDPATHALLEMGLAMREAMDPNGEIDTGPWHVVSEEITEETAVVKLKSISTGKEEEWTLRQIEGEWKIYINKNR